MINAYICNKLLPGYNKQVVHHYKFSGRIIQNSGQKLLLFIQWNQVWFVTLYKIVCDKQRHDRKDGRRASWLASRRRSQTNKNVFQTGRSKKNKSRIETENEAVLCTNVAGIIRFIQNCYLLLYISIPRRTRKERKKARNKRVMMLRL